VIRHDPVVHSVAASSTSHPMPHPPQSVRLVVEVSHPVASLSSQLSHPGSQAARVQVPAPHELSALSAMHGASQPPQCRGSLAVSTQLVPQMVALTGHVATQLAAPVETSQFGVAAAQASPHSLQSVPVPSGVSQPLLTTPSQSPQPSWHATSSQVPLPQLSVA
jgi:hypothetical protein